MSENPRLKPLFLVKPKTMSRRDIRRAEQQAGICIVECADPESARYSEPPLGANLDDQARAALSLFRMVMGAQMVEFKRSELMKWFIEALLKGAPPTPVPPVPRKP